MKNSKISLRVTGTPFPGISRYGAWKLSTTCPDSLFSTTCGSWLPPVSPRPQTPRRGLGNLMSPSPVALPDPGLPAGPVVPKAGKGTGDGRVPVHVPHPSLELRGRSHVARARGGTVRLSRARSMDGVCPTWLRTPRTAAGSRWKHAGGACERKQRGAPQPTHLSAPR